jgi:hypothetical protein
LPIFPNQKPRFIHQRIFDLAEKRLQNGGYETAQTPFGYFLDLQIKAPGHSLIGQPIDMGIGVWVYIL